MFNVEIINAVSKPLGILCATNPYFEFLPARIKKMINRFCGLFTVKAEWVFFDEMFDVIKKLHGSSG